MRHIALVAIIAMAAPQALAHEPADAVPVMIGHDGPDFDACGGWGRVSGLDPEGDNFLAVRAAPTTQASKMDELHEGEEVWFCDGTADQDWVGIVYGASREPGVDCQVGANLPGPVEYVGPCRSGWVSARYVTLLAG